MFKYILASLLFVSWVSGDLMDGIEPCPNNVPLPLDVYVYGCDRLPCHVHNGDIVYFEMDFLVHRFTDQLHPRVSIILGPLQIPFEIPPEDQIGCNSIIGTVHCPLFPNDVARYGLGMKVEAPVSGVTINLQFSLEDIWNQTVVCYRREQTVDPPRLVLDPNEK
ncbi:hypothetical protein DMENIID0001_019440 [Sergentomyia squamirostris]